MNALTVFGFVLLQAGGIKSDVNSFLSDYAVPIIAMVFVVSIGWGVAHNYDKIIDKDNQGTRKEGLINLAWIAGYVIVGLTVITILVNLVGSKLSLSI
jgi:hypothetical protein